MHIGKFQSQVVASELAVPHFEKILRDCAGSLDNLRHSNSRKRTRFVFGAIRKLAENKTRIVTFCQVMCSLLDVLLGAKTVH